MQLLPKLEAYRQALPLTQIPEERKAVLQTLIDYVQSKKDGQREAKLNFICTHNSRRSQFSQIWAQTAADYYGVDVQTYSGGVEVTAFNERAVAAIERAGFHVTKKEKQTNPVYFIFYSEDGEPITAFSKLYDDPANATTNFSAVMTCSHAEENCPYIPGTEARIPVMYDDPKAFDGTALETAKYDERCQQIAAEMFYVFSQIK
ncbi:MULTISPECIES: protein-tyrosine-phosphatase [unclassified Imperialibacter]|uniref:protein-tyrosine-phosphatase n=1 Tax=unclassified Imperialibacter TaxID=2629706 RepID=UPI0012547C59|nr:MULTISPECIES: protein-tyrosine-phosphatase [unclassified Imperialibacter]CAD5270949.1 Arsenate reductase [Imperialibacter sp. 89]CAD5298530.1 Arsenate reductase [Imperialibacter sp. 75]VVT34949.1 Arsenate reductase [Imperialibacter sp. EC-SDR9]